MNEIQIALMIVAVLLAIFITRLIFSIPTIVRQLKNQTNLLCLIAKKSGATDKEVKEELITKSSIVTLDS
jgi:hypothetical protein